MTTRRDLLQSGAAAIAAMAIPGSGANARSRNAASTTAEGRPDFSQGGTPVRLLDDETGNSKIGDCPIWNYDVEGTVQCVDKDELQAMVWHDNRWCKIDAVSDFDGKKVVWFDTRPYGQWSKPYGPQREPECAWEADVVCAFFAV